MIYNFNFQVKYFDIKEELLNKMHLKNDDVSNNILNNALINESNESNEDYEYTISDIMDICNKLYMDELASVFYADNILDDKIDIGMKYIRELMMENMSFKYMIEEIFIYTLKLSEGEPHKTTIEGNALDTIFCMLFSEDIFYLLHKCICQNLQTTNITHDLLIKIKDKIVNKMQID